jgi:hypothetical protein
VKAPLFGHNVPLRLHAENDHFVEGKQAFTLQDDLDLMTAWDTIWEESEDGLRVVALDAQYDQILPGSWVSILRPDESLAFFSVAKVETRTMQTVGMSARVTLLILDTPWISKKEIDKAKNGVVKGSSEEKKSIRQAYARILKHTVVYAQSESLELAEEPITGCVGNDLAHPEGASNLELGGLFDSLAPGRWLIVSGERADIRGKNNETIRGVMGNELVMLAGVTHGVHQIPQVDGGLTDLPGDKIHTFLQLADKGLSYCYQRETVKIFANVVKATHGETRAEVLGSGDPAQAFQMFALKQPPLTYVSAPTRDGIQSTLTVRVNDVAWPEAQGLSALDPNRRAFVIKTDDDAKTSVTFGAGTQLLSTQNARASYRNGLGQAGNVKADQLTLLATRPLGVKGVTNPIRGSGGADKESRDQAKQTAPLAVLSLDRLVSTQDYADFARTFAGIGKAHAMRLSNGTRQLVHITIAGVDDIPIDEQSDLLRNLRKALRELGDPSLPIEIEVRELLALIVSADVAIEPEYEWESVERRIRTALMEAFGFERRDLGQSVPASHVLSVIQQISGVRYVDLNVFSSLSEAELLDERRLQEKLVELKDRRTINVDRFDGVVTTVARFDRTKADADARTVPAQLAMLVSAVPDTLILNMRELPR